MYYIFQYVFYLNHPICIHKRDVVKPSLEANFVHAGVPAQFSNNAPRILGQGWLTFYVSEPKIQKQISLNLEKRLLDKKNI